MEKFYNLIEKSFMGPMTKLAEQRHLRAVRDGMVSTIPLTIIGSFFLILAFPPVPAAWKESVGIFQWINAHILDILFPFRLTMGLVAIFAAYNIGSYLARSYKLDRVTGGTLSLVAFMMTMVPQVAQTTGDNPESIGWVLRMDRLGGAGLFVSILAAVFAVEVLRFFKEKGFTIKMPAGVPESVTRSFEALFPTAFIVTALFILTHLVKFDIHNMFTKILDPVKGMVDTPIGAVLLVFFITMLWTAGIHGVSVIGAIARPVWLEMLTQNADALQAGQNLPYITPEPFFQWFIWIGGSGGTLGLCIAMVFFAKSKQLNELGKAAIIPSLFNINEPIIFGTPIMLNPFFTIPFVLGPTLAALLTYGVMALGIVAKPAVLAPWTFPAPIGAFLTTNGDFKAVILCLVNIVLMGAIYFPFFKAYDKKLKAQEAQTELEAKTV